ncbi:MAG TPA: hypothetical protein PK156_16955 [Polyangium sp.]|nr:hypothetical protein [Polyangium sp.]
MTSALLVPLNLDVLRLSQSRSVAGPLMDLERLPWASTAWGRDVNADTPYMTSGIAVPPFGGTQGVLEAGFHLHWALPDALCRGVVDSNTGKVIFPAVPNRWLVTRVLDGGVTRWIVESDHVWPSLANWPKDESFPRYHRGLAVTLLASSSNDDGQPFQHLGRAFSWNSWRESQGKGARRLDKLTAVGAGDIAFAAYHPHCHSVFGFFDPLDCAGNVPQNIEYRVLGWYSDPGQDPLMAPDISWDQSYEASMPTLKLASHQWKVSWPAKPQRTVCFASTRVVAEETPRSNTCVAVVANTGPEAMSTYLAAEVTKAAQVDAETQVKIEDQLEALQMGTLLNSRDVDLLPKLQAARHEQGFRPENGVPKWKITVVDGDVAPSKPLAATLEEGIHALNTLESELHLRKVEFRASQQALYADWCKYMAVAYHAPDEAPHLEIDVIKDYIERTHLRADKLGIEPVIVEKAQAIKRITGAIEQLVNGLTKSIKDFQKTLLPAGKSETTDPAPFKVEQVPGPRYWRPNDPVVLLTGGGIRVTERHGQDGRGDPDGYLLCSAREIAGDPWRETKPDFTEIADRLAVPAQIDPSRCTGFSETNGQPYNPIFVEWNIDLFPAESHSGPRFAGQRYDPNVIVHNYDLPPRASDLDPRVGVNIVADPDRYEGRGFLSSHASDLILARICAVLKEQLLDDYGPIHDSRYEQPYRDMLAAWHAQARGKAFYPADPALAGGYRFDVTQREALKLWYLERPLGPNGSEKLAARTAAQRFDDPLWTAICALDGLYEANGSRRAFVSTSLDGFNDKLMGFSKLPVLPIDEPIGFGSYRNFTRTIGELTGKKVVTPEPTSPYSPIRSGELEVSALRIVDSFGQLVDIEPTRVLGPIRYMSAGRSGALYFPPRVVQAMHAKFRWLDAEQWRDELVDVPGSEVICGWLVPNPNTHSITVFSRSGVGLGLLAIDRDEDYVEWVPAPGQPAFAHEKAMSSRDRDVLQMNAAINNQHLRRVVDHLWSAPTAYLSAFIDTLTDAQENIDPTASNQYNSMAMLMGRPLAVARAEMDIFPLESVMARGDWLDFERRIRGERSSDDGFAKIRFPMRLGDYRRLNDGVAGYWLEHPDGSFVDRCFHAQAADDVANLGNGRFDTGYKIEAHEKTPRDDDPIQRFEGQTINLRQTISDPALALTILFDPRGVVHLTTGILPTKVIDVPAAYFAESLERIELWLKAGPLLTRQGSHDLPLPADPEYDVVWREATWKKTATGEDDVLTWDDLRPTPTIRKEQMLTGLAQASSSLSIDWLMAKSWVAKIDADGIHYRLLPKEKRLELGLGETTEKNLGDYLEQNAIQIEEILTEAKFDKAFEAREGWLVFKQFAR